MVLAVDYMDKEEHLSLICDFAKAKNVKDSEMKDIAQMVRLVFHEETEGFLVSSKVSICFEKLLKDFGYQEKPISSAEEGLLRMGSIIGSFFGWWQEKEGSQEDAYLTIVKRFSRERQIHMGGGKWLKALYFIDRWHKAYVPLFPVFSAHTFRHTFASRCIEAGILPKTLQKYLGYATLQMTMDLYVHITEEFKKEELEKLDHVFSNENR